MRFLFTFLSHLHLFSLKIFLSEVSHLLVLPCIHVFRSADVHYNWHLAIYCMSSCIILARKSFRLNVLWLCLQNIWYFELGYLIYFFLVETRHCFFLKLKANLRMDMGRQEPLMEKGRWFMGVCSFKLQLFLTLQISEDCLISFYCVLG